jgi:hypothetical protein
MFRVLVWAIAYCVIASAQNQEFMKSGPNRGVSACWSSEGWRSLLITTRWTSRDFGHRMWPRRGGRDERQLATVGFSGPCDCSVQEASRKKCRGTQPVQKRRLFTRAARKPRIIAPMRSYRTLG